MALLPFCLLSLAWALGSDVKGDAISFTDDVFTPPSSGVNTDLSNDGRVRGTLRRLAPPDCVPSPVTPGLFECDSILDRRGCGSSAGVKEKYIVEETDSLGSGSFGEVKGGRHSITNQPVALKRVAGVTSSNRKAFQRLLTEIRVSLSLSQVHPNIVNTYEAYLYINGACLIMEKVDGRELLYELGMQPKESTLGGPSYHSSRRGRMGEQQARGFVRQVLQGLQEAHSRGVSWNDLKLENVMVGKDGGVKLIDWGLAENFTPGGVSEDGRQLPDPEISWAASGSPVYIPTPWADMAMRFVQERRSGRARGSFQLMVPPRGQDLYAAGVVLFKLLHGYDVDPTFRRRLSPAEGASLGSGIAAASPGSAFRAPVLASYLMSDLCADFLTKLLTSSSELSTAGLALQHPWFALPLPDMKLQIINNLRRPELLLPSILPPGWSGFVEDDLARVERELLPSVPARFSMERLGLKGSTGVDGSVDFSLVSLSTLASKGCTDEEGSLTSCQSRERIL